MAPGNAKILTTGDVARYCKVTPATVFNWIKAGKLKAFTTGGGHYRILPEELRDYLKAHLAPIPEELGQTDERRVLVVDDDEAFLNHACRTLRALDPRVRTATADNGFAACLELGSRAYALLVVDLLMPGMDGFELCRTLRGSPQTAALPLLVVSGFLDESSGGKLRALGVRHAVAKQAGDGPLLAAARELLGL